MHEQLDHGIFCLETGYHRPGTACCYLLVDHGEAAFIETGTARSVPLLLEALAQAGLTREQVRYVIPTHVHLDHAGGAGALLQHLPAATLLVHPRGARHLIDPTRLIEGAQQVYGAARFAELYGQIVAAPAERVCEALDHSSWPLGNRHLLIRDTPGHARHHFCIWDEASRGWFSVGYYYGWAWPVVDSGRRVEKLDGNYIQGSVAVPIGETGFEVSAHAGYSFGQYWSDYEYTDWSVGVGTSLGNFDVALKYVGSDQVENEDDIFNNEDRVILSVSTTLPWAKE